MRRARRALRRFYVLWAAGVIVVLSLSAGSFYATKRFFPSLEPFSIGVAVLGLLTAWEMHLTKKLSVWAFGKPMPQDMQMLVSRAVLAVLVLTLAMLLLMISVLV